ncbi:CHASE domain-containing protein [Pareuzebyella sediminis]|uniref:CHASE domain-containing protein n=1 Tax=Pareuzebyella sediminis TaxID=2607998 RepID=UPI0011EBB1F3|nr:CHASE domain-containing protein [Pareuzebyella sediminis]
MTRFQYFKYIAILLIGCSISFFVFFSINNRYSQRNRAVVENAITKSDLKLTDELNKISLVVESMGFFFENNSQVSQKAFERFTDPFLKQLKGIRAITWSPRIENKEKDAQLFSAIKTIDSSNSLISTEPKDVHFPIKLINPLGPLNEAVGFDLYSDTLRRSAIETTIRTNKMSLTGPIRLVLQDNGVPGILSLKAVIDTTSNEVKGLVTGVYRMDDFIGSTLASELLVLDICVHDISANNQLLFSTIDEASISKDLQNNLIRHQIKAANRNWEIHYVPKPNYFSFPNAFESYAVLIFGLTTTLLLTYLVRKRDVYNERLEARVLLRTAELEESNLMKENLLREIHHRVKNNLQITSSLMNMQKRKLTSKEAITALSDSQARISAIALTHQKIYQDKDSKAVNLRDYLVDLMEYQKKISSSFSYKIDCPEISVDLDRAVPLALIISELVTNAVKHAYPDTLKYNELLIDVTRLHETQVLLTIRDNGQGLPANFDIKKAEGIGFEIIRALCRQIAADLTYESNDYGTQFSLTFENRMTSEPNLYDAS